MLVKATKDYKDRELGRNVIAGEVFNVTPHRAVILINKNAAQEFTIGEVEAKYAEIAALEEQLLSKNAEIAALGKQVASLERTLKKYQEA